MSRLRKGQRAASVETRAREIRANVRARLERLDQVLLAGDTASAPPCWSASFEAFARWSEPSGGINSLSPKTLRRHVNEILSGGQSELLTKLAAARDVQHPSRTRGSRCPEGKAKDEALIDHVHAFSQRYLDLLERLRRLGASSADARETLAKHLRLFSADAPIVRRVK